MDGGTMRRLTNGNHGGWNVEGAASAVERYMLPVLERVQAYWIQKHVRADHVHIFLKATAGLRVLPAALQTTALAQLTTLVHQHGFTVGDEFGVITGVKEAMYAWVTVTAQLGIGSNRTPDGNRDQQESGQPGQHEQHGQRAADKSVSKGDEVDPDVVGVPGSAGGHQSRQADSAPDATSLAVIDVGGGSTQLARSFTVRQLPFNLFGQLNFLSFLRELLRKFR